MAVNGVNRIIVAVRDLEKAKSYYTDLLGATFYEANWTGEAFGIEVAINWNAGIELCAPIPGRESDCFLTALLDQRGEGILNVVFNVDDADQALVRAKAVNIQTINSLDYTQEEIDKHLNGLFSRYKEYFLNTGAQCGYGITLGQFEAKRGQEEATVGALANRALQLMSASLLRSLRAKDGLDRHAFAHKEPNE